MKTYKTRDRREAMAGEGEKEGEERKEGGGSDRMAMEADRVGEMEEYYA